MDQGDRSHDRWSSGFISSSAVDGERLRRAQSAADEATSAPDPLRFTVTGVQSRQSEYALLLLFGLLLSLDIVRVAPEAGRDLDHAVGGSNRTAALNRRAQATTGRGSQGADQTATRTASPVEPTPGSSSARSSMNQVPTKTAPSPPRSFPPPNLARPHSGSPINSVRDIIHRRTVCTCRRRPVIHLAPATAPSQSPLTMFPRPAPS